MGERSWEFKNPSLELLAPESFALGSRDLREKPKLSVNIKQGCWETKDNSIRWDDTESSLLKQ